MKGEGAWVRSALTASGETVARPPLVDQTRSAKERTAKMMWISEAEMGKGVDDVVQGDWAVGNG